MLESEALGFPPLRCEREQSFHTYSPKWWWMIFEASHGSTPPKFSIAPEKNAGWKTTFLLGWIVFRGELLNFQGVSVKRLPNKNKIKKTGKKHRFTLQKIGWIYLAQKWLDGSTPQSFPDLTGSYFTVVPNNKSGIVLPRIYHRTIPYHRCPFFEPPKKW